MGIPKSDLLGVTTAVAHTAEHRPPPPLSFHPRFNAYPKSVMAKRLLTNKTSLIGLAF